MNSVLLMAPQGGESGGLASYLPLVLIVVIFYFFMIRPQQQKAKKAKEFRSNLDKGAKIVTIGGIHGVIESMSDDTVVISTKGGGKLEIERSAVSMEGSANEMEMKGKSA